MRGLINQIALTPKACGAEYAIDLHGDLAGTLTVAAGKRQKIEDNDPLLQQVRMMTESSDQNKILQDDSCIDENLRKDSSLGKSEMIVKESYLPHSSTFLEKPHNTEIPSKGKMVAGAGFEPTTFGL